MATSGAQCELGGGNTADLCLSRKKLLSPRRVRRASRRVRLVGQPHPMETNHGAMVPLRALRHARRLRGSTRGGDIETHLLGDGMG